MSGKSVYRYRNIWCLGSAIFQIVGLDQITRLLERACISEFGKLACGRVDVYWGVWVCAGRGFILLITASHSLQDIGVTGGVQPRALCTCWP